MTILEELHAQMKQAIKVFNDSGQTDMTKINEVSNAMNKAKAEIAKAEAIQAEAEAGKLAGAREALEQKFIGLITALGLDKDIVALKCRGLSYWIKTTYPVAGQPDLTQQLSAKLVPVVVVGKTRKTGGGGNGKTKAEYGMSLAEVVEKFATPAEKAVIAGLEKGAKWQKQVAVKKRAIAEGKLAPVK